VVAVDTAMLLRTEKATVAAAAAVAAAGYDFVAPPEPQELSKQLSAISTARAISKDPNAPAAADGNRGQYKRKQR
jgi:hypothetical protein